MKTGIVAYAHELGADLVGVADLEHVRGIETSPAGLLAPFTRAIVMGVQLGVEVFEQIQTEPTPLYAREYTQANGLLDRASLLLQQKLSALGHRALAIPAAQTVDRDRRLGHVSTKALAKAAGLGWIGKSLLLVTPEYGPRVRIGCVLTDAPLMPDPVMMNRCGSCTRCKDACPVGAIYGASWEDHPPSREDAIDLSKCVERLGRNAQIPGIGANICGVCIKVCTWAQTRQPA